MWDFYYVQFLAQLAIRRYLAAATKKRRLF